MPLVVSTRVAFEDSLPADLMVLITVRVAVAEVVNFREETTQTCGGYC